MRQIESARGAVADRRGVFALLRALADSGLDLVHGTARMAASEGRIVLHRVAVRLGFLVAGLLVAAVGLLLGLVGVALVLARVAGLDDWQAFLAVGVVTLAIGAVFAARAMRRLGGPDLAFPATLAELEADIEVLRNGPGDAGDGTP